MFSNMLARQLKYSLLGFSWVEVLKLIMNPAIWLSHLPLLFQPSWGSGPVRAQRGHCQCVTACGHSHVTQMLSFLLVTWARR